VAGKAKKSKITFCDSNVALFSHPRTEPSSLSWAWTLRGGRRRGDDSLLFPAKESVGEYSGRKSQKIQQSILDQGKRGGVQQQEKPKNPKNILS
jgi:hypothetical protein